MLSNNPAQRSWEQRNVRSKSLIVPSIIQFIRTLTPKTKRILSMLVALITGVTTVSAESHDQTECETGS